MLIDDWSIQPQGTDVYNFSGHYVGRVTERYVAVNLTCRMTHDESREFEAMLFTENRVRIVREDEPTVSAGGVETIARAFFGLDHAGEGVTPAQFVDLRVALDELWNEATDVHESYRARARRFLSLLKVPR